VINLSQENFVENVRLVRDGILYQIASHVPWIGKIIQRYLMKDLVRLASRPGPVKLVVPSEVANPERWIANQLISARGVAIGGARASYLILPGRQTDGMVFGHTHPGRSSKPSQIDLEAVQESDQILQIILARVKGKIEMTMEFRNAQGGEPTVVTASLTGSKMPSSLAGWSQTVLAVPHRLGVAAQNVFMGSSGGLRNMMVYHFSDDVSAGREVGAICLDVNGLFNISHEHGKMKLGLADGADAILKKINDRRSAGGSEMPIYVVSSDPRLSALEIQAAINMKFGENVLPLAGIFTPQELSAARTEHPGDCPLMSLVNAPKIKLLTKDEKQQREWENKWNVPKDLVLIVANNLADLIADILFGGNGQNVKPGSVHFEDLDPVFISSYQTYA
jgi:hypothetical protein